MKKLRGYMKKKKNYTSVMYIPHSSRRIKSVRISNYHTKLIALYATLVMVLLLMTGYISYILKENRTLQTHAENLENLIITQKKLLDNKVAMLEKFKNQELLSKSQIKEYSSNLCKVVDAYVKNGFKKLTVSRASNKDTPSFVNDIAELHSVLTFLNESNISEDELLKDLNNTKKELEDFLKTIPTFRPVSGSIRSPFGMRMHPIFKVRKLHTGIDIAALTGEPIKAAASGKVIFAGWNGGYGKCVIIDHGNNLYTRYAHCSKLLVSKGDYVNQGDLIARVGATGTATASHLHFEIRIGNVPVDPMKFLEK